MVHIWLLCSHHWQENIFPNLALRIVSQHSKNRYKMTVARRWYLDLRRLLLRMVASHVLFKESDMKTTGSHAINRASDLWRIYGRDVVDHPLYSPDFVTSEFHLLEPLKKHLAGKKFATDDDVEQTGTSCLGTLHRFPLRRDKKPWCHVAVDIWMSVVNTWWFNVYHVLATSAMHTSKSEQCFRH